MRSFAATLAILSSLLVFVAFLALGFALSSPTTVTITKSYAFTTTVTKTRSLETTVTRIVNVGATHTYTTTFTTTTTVRETKVVSRTTTVTKTVTKTVTIVNAVTKTVTTVPSTNLVYAAINEDVDYLAKFFEELKNVSGAMLKDNILVLYSKGVARYVRFVSSNGSTYDIVTDVYVPKLGTVDRAYFSKNFSVIVLNLSRMASTIPSGSYSVELWSGLRTGRIVLRCSLVLDDRSSVLGGCKTLGDPKYVDCNEINGSTELSDLNSARVCYFDESVLREVRSIVFGNRSFSTLSQLVWSVATWVANNVVYDDEKASKRLPGTYSPLETVELGKGVCRDVAVLTTALLLSFDVQPVYMVSLHDYLHMAAMIEVNNTYVVLDQAMPPSEVGDYLQYVLGVNGSLSNVSVIKVWIVEGEPVLEFVGMYRLEPIDTYPSDEPDNQLVEKIVEIVRSRHSNLVPDPSLENLIRSGSYACYVLRGPRLSTANASPYPLVKLYTPILLDGWANYLANYVEQLLRKYFSNVLASGGRFWIDIEGFELRVVATTS